MFICVKFLNGLATGLYSIQVLDAMGSVAGRPDVTVFGTVITALVIHQKASRLLVNIN